MPLASNRLLRGSLTGGGELRVDCIKRIRPFFILCAEELVPKGFLDPNFSGIWLKYGNFDEKVTWTFSKIDF